jgi:hypothetical protein
LLPFARGAHCCRACRCPFARQFRLARNGACGVTCTLLTRSLNGHLVHHNRNPCPPWPSPIRHIATLIYHPQEETSRARAFLVLLRRYPDPLLIGLPAVPRPTDHSTCRHLVYHRLWEPLTRLQDMSPSQRLPSTSFLITMSTPLRAATTRMPCMPCPLRSPLDLAPWPDNHSRRSSGTCIVILP